MNRRVITLNAKSARFKASGEIGEGARIDELTDKHCGGLGIAADEVDESVPVEPKAGDVLVVDEVLSLDVEFVSFIPIPPNSQNSLRALLDGHDVRQSDPSRLTVFVFVLEPRQVKEDVHLKDAIAVVTDAGEAHLLGLLLLNVVKLVARLTKLHITVEPSLHQTHHFLLGLTHDVCDALGVLNIGRSIRHHDVLGGDEHRHLTPFARVVVDLFER